MLDFITNNQAGSVILDTNGVNGIDIYVTNENFAKKRYRENDTSTHLDTKKYRGLYYIGTI